MTIIRWSETWEEWIPFLRKGLKATPDEYKCHICSEFNSFRYSIIKDESKYKINIKGCAKCEKDYEWKNLNDKTKAFFNIYLEELQKFYKYEKPAVLNVKYRFGTNRSVKGEVLAVGGGVSFQSTFFEIVKSCGKCGHENKFLDCGAHKIRCLKCGKLNSYDFDKELIKEIDPIKLKFNSDNEIKNAE